MKGLAENLHDVMERIEGAAKKAGRDPAGIRLVAVSKTKPVSLIRSAITEGQIDFGENYAQELRDKQNDLPCEKLRWHFIGHLQKNKVKYVAGKVYEVHSIDGLALAREMDKRSEKAGKKTRVMIEVNLAGEDSKTGVSEKDALALAKEIRKMDALELVGLMTMPPYFSDPEDVRPYYRGLRELRDRLSEELGDALPELSMGLSHDFEVAIEEGATRVRVGTAIFGERNYS